MVSRVVLLAVVIFLLVVVPDESEAWWRRRRRRQCRPTNCAVSSWSRWGRCSSSCMGTQTRTRTKTRAESCGGSCPYQLRQTRSCNDVCQNGGTRGHGTCRCRSGFTGRCCEIRACCQEGSVEYNRCGERCTCRGGRMTECTRIRKEFTTMTTAERTKYVNTVKVASTDARYKTEYDELLTLHRTLFNREIHDKRNFLPWHRWFILRYENLLRKVDCTVTVTYWDWSRVSANPWRGSSSDVWYTGSSGFGGNGSPACVVTGPFSWPTWRLVPSADSGCLRRQFNGIPPDTIAVQRVLNTPVSEFGDFELELRSNLHDNVHCHISGTMCSIDAASAPEFFLHHGFIDKLWDDWQAKSSSHRNEYFSGLSHTMPGTSHTPRDFIDLTSHPEGERVEYRPAVGTIGRQSQGHQVSALKVMGSSRPRFTTVNERAMNLFHLSSAERRKTRELAKKLDPVKSG